LLLAEKNQLQEAAVFLKKAAEGLPQRSRVHYNFGLLLQSLQQDAQAENSLLRALTLEPENLDYLYALADFYIKRRRFEDARDIAKQMIARHPSDPLGPNLLSFIKKAEQQTP
jgi:Tfp pilus assembly protein PilF